MIITLDKAVRLIKATINANDGCSHYPYFFIVGAGVSMPEIPSSNQIIEICKKKVEKDDPDYYVQCLEETRCFESNQMRYYSEWISIAYPNKINRSSFFKRLSKKARISSGNLLLAQILYSKQVSTTVFTPNFDDKIEEALNLLGANDVFSAENAMDNLAINVSSDDLQVIHVHGSYSFYDCANLTSEIENIASSANILSSRQLIRNYLSNQSPIIVGYSGWENDVIMTGLKERLAYPTPCTYIWVCHSNAAYDILPDWIKTNENMAFVLPQSQSGSNCEETATCIHEYFGPASHNKDAVLDATQFFGALIALFKVVQPQILSNPYLYFSEMINNMLPQHEDVLHLRHWAKRMKHLGANETAFERSVNEMEHAFALKDIKEATRVIQVISSMSLHDTEAIFVCDSLIGDFLGVTDSLTEFEVEYNIAFHEAILDFLEQKYDQLVLNKTLDNTLKESLFVRGNIKNEEAFLHLVNRVYDISKRSSETLLAHLTSLGVKSSAVKNKRAKIELLQELVSKCPASSADKDFQYLKCLALLELSELLEDSDAIDAYYAAEQENKILKDSHLINRSLLVKSSIINKINDPEIRLTWLRQIISSVEMLNTKLKKQNILRIIANVCNYPLDDLQKIEGINTFLISFIDDFDLRMLENCEHVVSFIEICNTICDINKSNYPRQLDMCSKAFELLHKIPKDCHKSSIILKALLFYCQIPISIVPDTLKVNRLLEYKNNYINTANVHYVSLFRDIIQIAIQIGDIEKYRNSELTEDVSWLCKREELSDAVKSYKLKEYATAEQAFTKLVLCGFEEIAEKARINLGFMTRRKETHLNSSDFWEIIAPVKNDDSLKLMNIILYCLEEELTDDIRYTSAIELLKIVPRENFMQAYNCWSNVELVGKSESDVAMKILTKVLAEKST